MAGVHRFLAREQACVSPDSDAFLPEPGWRPLEMPRSFGQGRSFVSGHPESDIIRIRYFQAEQGTMLFAKVWFGLGAEGPPGHAHGGSMAAVLDECMGFSCWVNGHPVVAATITINFKKSLPLHHVFLVEASPIRVEGVKVETTGKVYDPRDGTIFSDGTGLFIIQPLERFEGMRETQKRQQDQRDQERQNQSL
jgi:acyl-coenzyme A thioesterase PaaI-like protein